MLSIAATPAPSAVAWYTRPYREEVYGAFARADSALPEAHSLDSAGLTVLLAGWLGLTAMLAELSFRLIESPLIARGARRAAGYAGRELTRAGKQPW